MLIAVPMRGDLEQAVEILPFKADDADGIDVPELAFAHSQRGARYFNRIIKSALAATERFEQPAGFLAAATAQFCDSDRSRQPLHDLARVPAQQALICPG